MVISAIFFLIRPFYLVVSYILCWFWKRAYAMYTATFQIHIIYCRQDQEGEEEEAEGYRKEEEKLELKRAAYTDMDAYTHL